MVLRCLCDISPCRHLFRSTSCCPWLQIHKVPLTLVSSWSHSFPITTRFQLCSHSFKAPPTILKHTGKFGYSGIPESLRNALWSIRLGRAHTQFHISVAKPSWKQEFWKPCYQEGRRMFSWLYHPSLSQTGPGVWEAGLGSPPVLVLSSSPHPSHKLGNVI